MSMEINKTLLLSFVGLRIRQLISLKKFPEIVVKEYLNDVRKLVWHTER